MTGKNSIAAFEKNLSELEALVEKLEQGELSLDESLKQFERGIKLARDCQQSLSKAEQRIQIMLESTDEATEFSAKTDD